MQLHERFEYATDDDPSLCYCLWPYQRPAPAADKFRAVNLLYQSFAEAGLPEGAYATVDALREGIGAFRTVFGIKWADGRLGWEYYFYDYLRVRRTVGADEVLRALAPVVRSDVALDARAPYFMFSLDLDAALARGERAIDVLHMYVGNPGSAVSSGVSYAVRPDSQLLENFYFFFDAATQMPEVARKLENSPHALFGMHGLDEVLVPELRDCRTICVANKRTHDCVYFSGVTVDQLLFFLRRWRYPAGMVAFIQQHRDRLDHLTYDVGIDFALRDGRPVGLKSGWYGVF